MRGTVAWVACVAAAAGCGGSSSGGTTNADGSSGTYEAGGGSDAPSVPDTSVGDATKGSDAAPGQDADHTLDAGSGLDATSTTDSSSTTDAPPPDGATIADASKGPDGSSLDGSNATDAPSALDAAPDSHGVTDGATEADAQPVVDAGDQDATCTSHATPRTLGGTAQSSGFSGTALAYDSISGAACMTGGDCVPTCMAAGGTMASCATGSACVMGEAFDGGLGCFPPSYWMSPNLALSELDMTSSAATLTMVATSYFDSLVVTNFGLSVPDGATIEGIQFDVRRATMFGDGEDKSIQVLQNGAQVGANHRETGTAWPTTLTYVTYGGPTDTWGVSWTPADVRATGFGIAITPQYTMMAGNDPAYVDSVRVTVYYTQCN